jgi:tetratricopeptide (TPR) repeat protein
MIHQRAGRIPEAEECYRRIIEIDPAHADAYRLLGVVARQTGKLESSEQLIRQAILCNPSVWIYHHDLGQTYELHGNIQRAIQSYRHALSLNPENAESIRRLADLLSEAGELDEAAALFERLLQMTPSDAEAHYDLGRLRKRRGDLQAAVNCYRSAINLRPNCFEIHFNLAAALFQVGMFEESAHSYQQALRLQPNDAEAHYSLGVALQESGKFEAAAESYANAIRLKADYAEAYSNLGIASAELGNLPMAINFLRYSLTLQPSSPDIHCNLGNLLFKQGDTIAAIDSYRNGLMLQPDHAVALANLGVTLETLGDAESAEECYQSALKSRPDFSLAKFFLGLHQLSKGEFSVGWNAYEHRWVSKECRSYRRTFSQPRWRGEDIQGSRILLYAEQGLGDTMQFVRYLSMLLARGAEIILEVQPNLYRLLKNSFEQVRVIRAGEAHPDFDWQCPLLSLPLAFGTDLESIPSSGPYLRVEATAAAIWAERLSADTLRVGLAWAGNPKHSRERQRSISLEQLARLTRIEGLTFYSLQKGAAAAPLKSRSSDLRLIDLDAGQEDFADTAAIAANLDLVISIDTSVAHLAGAIGRPVWILLHHMPDWRWLRGRSDSPWYPTARLFRQTVPGNWNGVLDQLEESLRALVNDRTSNASNLSEFEHERMSPWTSI